MIILNINGTKLRRNSPVPNYLISNNDSTEWFSLETRTGSEPTDITIHRLPIRVPIQ